MYVYSSSNINLIYNLRTSKAILLRQTLNILNINNVQCTLPMIQSEALAVLENNKSDDTKKKELNKFMGYITSNSH